MPGSDLKIQYIMHFALLFEWAVLAQGRHLGAAMAEMLVSLLQGPGSAWQRPSRPGRAPQDRAMSCLCCAPALLQATCTWGYFGTLDPLANADVVLLPECSLKIGLKTAYSHYARKAPFSCGKLLSQQPDLCRARSVAPKCQGCMPLEINDFSF